ncbi:MAG TPA: lipid-transfer protein [Deltaproteobacteria bacterium]|nr:lipid-transfer protein [Deltaproteobacteria bacterium]
MGRSVFVVGVGMTEFVKPGSRGWDYPDMVRIAGRAALADAGLAIEQIEQVSFGYASGPSTCGERAFHELGMTGIPIYNVNNACASGSTALFMAKQFVEGGLSECVMAVGFEKMQRGSLAVGELDRELPAQRHLDMTSDLCGFTDAPPAAQFFGNAGIEYMNRHGLKPEHFAKVAFKNHKHSVDNPLSQFRQEYTLDEILESPRVFGPLTRLQCCPTSDGSAAVILCSEDFVKRNGLGDGAVEIAAMSMHTEFPSTFGDRSMVKLVGFDMARSAAAEVYSASGVRPDDIDVVELHDCFSSNELLTYEALRLCEGGEVGDYVDSGANTHGGQHVVNPSGGLISKGHPIGATGIAQCVELCWQLRGDAGSRQVEGARNALQHNVGLGAAVVVALYRKG